MSKYVSIYVGMYVCMYVCMHTPVRNLTQRTRYHYECKWENLTKKTQRIEENNEGIIKQALMVHYIPYFK
jgi:hypothetical protein